MKEKIEKARQLGREEAIQMRREAIEDGSYVTGQSSDWDAGLINAIGANAVAELFDCEPDTDLFRKCCEAYNAGGIDGWDCEGTNYQ